MYPVGSISFTRSVDEFVMTFRDLTAQMEEHQRRVAELARARAEIIQTLRYDHRFTYRAIAERTGISYARVEQLLAAGRAYDHATSAATRPSDGCQK